MSSMVTENQRLHPLLMLMVKQGAADIYLTTGAFASIKAMGELRKVSKETLKPGYVAQLAQEVLTAEEWDEFTQNRELNKGLALKGIGRFRMNLYFQRGEVSMVVRYIKSVIPDSTSLGLPEVLKEGVMARQGMILFVGATGSGKSTSMAALIEHRNQHHRGHILTIEDPIEYTFRHGLSIIGQREVGSDTHSYASAMREAMREAPDMIMVGEIRDADTIKAVMGFADSGHLVMSTLHAINVTQAMERILYLFPSDDHRRAMMDLSLSLRMIVAQRLIPSKDGSGLELASEVLVNTPYIAELIRKGKFQELMAVMEKGSADGMHSFDQSIIGLFKDGKISRESAMTFASSRNNVEWQLNFGKSGFESKAVGAGVFEGTTDEKTVYEAVAEKNESDKPRLEPV